jgi:HEAT repeat protein
VRERLPGEALQLALRALERGDADQQALVVGILSSLGERRCRASSSTSHPRKTARPQDLLDVVLRAGQTAVPHVRRLLEDPRAEVQRNAVFLLRRLNDTECQPLLKARLRTAAPLVAAEILKFLITVQDPEWQALLLRELAATDEERLAAAAAVAGYVPREEVVDRVVARLGERVGPGLREDSTLELIRAAGRLRSPAALPVLQEILKLRQWRFRFPLGPVRIEAARAVAQLEGNEARRLAYSLASSGEAGVAEAAQDGLRRSRSRERKAEA